MPRLLVLPIAVIVTHSAGVQSAPAPWLPRALIERVETGLLSLAQQWTPLTGPLGRDQGKKEPAAEPEPAPAPPPPADTSLPAPEGHKLTLKATLGSGTGSDGLDVAALGVRTSSVDNDLTTALGLDQKGGGLVTELVRDSAAEAAAMRVGDVVLRLDQRQITTHEDLMRIVRSYRPGSEVEVELWRAGEGANDLRRLLQSRSDAGQVSASVGLARLLYLGLVFPKDDGQAALLFRKAAEAGHVQAMTSYAILLKDGIGVQKNETEAAKWFLKGADGGNELAMANLAQLYETGRGATKSDAEAALWYRKAADAGNAYAMLRLALMSEAGRGVAKDEAEAARLLKLASEKGLSEATSKLARKYAQGEGVAKDPAEAGRLNTRAAEQLRRAADQGQAVAMFNLGLLYRIGKGVAKSDAEAGRWIIASFKKGDQYLVSELMRNPDVLVPADRKWVQTLLREQGSYTGPIDGKFGPAVREAMTALAGKR